MSGDEWIMALERISLLGGTLSSKEGAELAKLMRRSKSMESALKACVEALEAHLLTCETAYGVHCCRSPETSRKMLCGQQAALAAAREALK